MTINTNNNAKATRSSVSPDAEPKTESKKLTLKNFRRLIKKINPLHLMKQAFKSNNNNNKKERKVECVTENKEANAVGKEDGLPSIQAGFKKVRPFKSIDGADGASGQVGLVVKSNKDNTGGALMVAKIPHEKIDGVAHKVTFDEASLETRILDEVAIMDKIGDHKNIIRIDKEFGVMEYAGDSISKLIKKEEVGQKKTNSPYDEVDLQSDGNVVAADQSSIEASDRIPKGLVHTITKQLFNGLDGIHKKGVVHLDIKPENILITQGAIVKIADFGCAQSIEEGEMTTKPSGDKGYMPAEAIQKGSKKDCSVDVWSAGATVYELLGHGAFIKTNLIFDAHNAKDVSFFEKRKIDPEIMKNHIEKKINSVCEKIKKEKPVRYSSKELDTLHDFLTKTLALNPQDRMTAEEALSHPFIVNEESKFGENAVDNGDKID